MNTKPVLSHEEAQKRILEANHLELQFLLQDYSITGQFQGINGNTFYLKNSEYHRENGPAVIGLDGTEIWYLNGMTHRVGGPALTHPSYASEKVSGQLRYEYYQNNKLHREDGPAVIEADGRVEYWLNGVRQENIS